MPKAKTERLKAERDAVVPKSVRTVFDIFVASAKGHTVRDVEGRTYLDFTSGIGSLTTGHRPERVVRAVREQLDHYLHLCFMVFNYEPYVALARHLQSLVPIQDAKSAFFNSGAEAIENAAKVARAYTKRPGLVSFHNAFHGRTLLALSLTGKFRPYKVGFEPLMSHVYHAPYPYHYRCPSGHAESDCAARALDVIEGIFHAQSADRIAAVFVEPVQGEGGFVVPPNEFLLGLRKLCDEHGILLVDDEVQAGLGRTGRMFAIEHFGVRPDLVVTAKALGGGLPLSGLTGAPDIMDAPEPGSIGGTFGGNPLACVAAIENLKLIEASLPHARRLGDVIAKRFQEMADAHPLIGDARGLGPMRALELVRNRRTKEPAAKEAKVVQQEARNRGLLVLTAGWHDNVIRVLPPVTLSIAAMGKGLDILDKAIGAVERS